MGVCPWVLRLVAGPLSRPSLLLACARTARVSGRPRGAPHDQRPPRGARLGATGPRRASPRQLVGALSLARRAPHASVRSLPPRLVAAALDHLGVGQRGAAHVRTPAPEAKKERKKRKEREAPPPMLYNDLGQPLRRVLRGSPAPATARGLVQPVPGAAIQPRPRRAGGRRRSSRCTPSARNQSPRIAHGRSPRCGEMRDRTDGTSLPGRLMVGYVALGRAKP